MENGDVLLKLRRFKDIREGRMGKKPGKMWCRPLWTAPKQNSNYAYHTPPKCIGQTLKIVVYIFFHQVYDKWWENQAKKTNIDCGNQLLWKEEEVNFLEGAIKVTVASYHRVFELQFSSQCKLRNDFKEYHKKSC